MSRPTLYARYEPTTDVDVLAASHVVDSRREDVMVYYDSTATQLAARYPWYAQSRPSKLQKTTMLNCARWKLIWLTGDLPESPIPHHSDHLFAASV